MEPNRQVHHWRPVLVTDDSRFTLSTSDRHGRDWKSRGERYAACNIVYVLGLLGVFQTKMSVESRFHGLIGLISIMVTVEINS